MFHRVTDASKIALVALVQHCRATGIELLDVQMPTAHLASLGAVTIRRAEYLRRLAAVVDRPVNFTAAASVPPVE
jgi:leucyl/phenylalanyl-tRNA--protein transferase